MIGLNKRFLYAFLALFLGTLACEPMIGIGQNELLCLLIVGIVLLGPPLYRFAKRVDKFLKHENREK